MRLVDADELIEHAWRDKLDSRELIVEMIERAPTVKSIPTQIPMDVYERLLKQEPKTGRWIDVDGDNAICGCCNRLNHLYGTYCKHCGAKMESEEV